MSQASGTEGEQAGYGAFPRGQFIDDIVSQVLLHQYPQARPCLTPRFMTKVLLSITP